MYYPEHFGTKFVATRLLLLGIIGLYIEQFTDTIDSYAQRGTDNTKRLNELKAMYYQCKDDTENDNKDFPKGYNEIIESFYSQKANNLFSLDGLLTLRCFLKRSMSNYG